MIGSLEGIIESKETGTILLNVQGVGYEIHLPKNHAGLLPTVGKTIKIYTYLHITETAHTLFGFLTQHQKKLFIMLISVSGIGPKIAINIISEVTPDQIIKAIATGDAAFMSQLHGIGKKTAERLIIDLKDKILTLAPENFEFDANAQEKLSLPQDTVQDVVSALSQLGYNSKEIKNALNRASDLSPESTAEEVIRKMLKFL